MRVSKWVAAAAVAFAFVGGGPVVAQASAAMTPLTIDGTSLVNGGKACATSAPLPTLGNFGSTLQAARTATSTTVYSYTFTFELWPSSDPTSTTDVTATSYGSSLLATGNVPAAALTSGTTYSWRVNVSDGMSTSAWSTTCSFQYDTTPPPAPTVTSNYPQNTWGPLGQQATFTLSGGGNPDVGGFLYTWGYDLPMPACSYSGPLNELDCPDFLSQADVIKPTTPGGTATLTLNPPGSGPQTLTVSSIDAAGNMSQPPVHYQIMVRSAAPTVTIVDSQAICGNNVRVAFAPHPGVDNVASYSYALDYGKTTTIRADANGTATAVIPVTADSSMLKATSTSKSGFTSDPSYTILDVNPQPFVHADVYLNDGQPAGGIGVPGTFTLSPPWDGTWPGSYTYRFSDDAPKTVAADPNDDTAVIHWTPKRAGAETLTVTSNNADGSGSSCAMQYTFNVAPTPK